MNWTDIGNPAPLQEPVPYAPVSWPDGKRRPLDSNFEDSKSTFAQIAYGRSSRHTFAPLPKAHLSHLLSLTCRVRETLSISLGFAQSQRPAPSAGAIHPIHVVLSSAGERNWHRYDPFTHSLIELKSHIGAQVVREALDAVLPSGEATVILFVAEPQMSFAKYRAATSLVWRDAGVLQGYFAAAAEALALHFCLLGVTGEPWAGQLVDGGGVVGVGAAYVGAPP